MVRYLLASASPPAKLGFRSRLNVCTPAVAIISLGSSAVMRFIPHQNLAEAAAGMATAAAAGAGAAAGGHRGEAGAVVPSRKNASADVCANFSDLFRRPLFWVVYFHLVITMGTALLWVNQAGSFTAAAVGTGHVHYFATRLLNRSSWGLKRNRGGKKKNVFFICLCCVVKF